MSERNFQKYYMRVKRANVKENDDDSSQKVSKSNSCINKESHLCSISETLEHQIGIETVEQTSETESEPESTEISIFETKEIHLGPLEYFDDNGTVDIENKEATEGLSEDQVGTNRPPILTQGAQVGTTARSLPKEHTSRGRQQNMPVVNEVINLMKSIQSRKMQDRHAFSAFGEAVENLENNDRSADILILPPEVDVLTDEENYSDEEFPISSIANDVPGQIELHFLSSDENDEYIPPSQKFHRQPQKSTRQRQKRKVALVPDCLNDNISIQMEDTNHTFPNLCKLKEVLAECSPLQIFEKNFDMEILELIKDESLLFKMQVNKSILKQFLCLSCNKIMHPPIRICMLGHNFCSTCDSKSEGCPYCNYEKNQGRNISLENLYECFKFPCGNQRRGCAFVGKGVELKQHQPYCKFAAVKCPLKIFDCDWHGKQSDILEHVRNDHPDCLLELDPSTSSIVIGTKLVPSTFIRTIIRIQSELFLFTWCINSNCTTMRWQIIYLGTNNLEKFQYNIELYDPLEAITIKHNNGKDNCKKPKCYIEFTDETSFERFIHFERVRCRISIIKDVEKVCES
ncbi:hypothetical protein RN001_004269 [Aquatica leii]|uniref:RING-type E3 ubiquitin transferase n=1 Tax=Aquatica leii TaxID=1421715 RepID=A0AAN7SRM3_9COLE|nr:hypothetical protein RN001_004269 [Aquatica leii]